MRTGIALISLFLFVIPVTLLPRHINRTTHSETGRAFAPSDPDSRFALLVGIAKYRDRSIGVLRGPENDVRLMKGILGSQYGFSESSVDGKVSGIRTLLSDEATRDAILKAFREQLIERAEGYFKRQKLSQNTRDKGATVVFYYSGHGATLPDLDPSGHLAFEEPDGLDETIVPYDSVKATGENAIRDDEFDRLFGELSKWTTNITFIFDSCHSGTVTRATEGVRRIEFDYKLPESAREEIEKLRSSGTDIVDSANLTDSIDDFRMQTRGSDELVGYVTISGCLPNQLSQERYLKKGSRRPTDDINGLLTHYLVLELGRNAGATYREVLKNIQAGVQAINPSQTPQFEGDIDRPVFNIAPGRSGVTRRMAIEYRNPVGSLDSANRTNSFTVDLEAGTLVGAMKGGVVAVYRKDAPVLSGDEFRIGSGTILTADDFSSSAAVTLKGNPEQFPEGAFISLVTPYFGTEKVTIALGKTGGADKVLEQVAELAADKTAGFSDYLTAKPVSDPLGARAADRHWDAAVVRVRYKEFKFGSAQPKTEDSEVPGESEEVYMIADVNGMPLYNFFVPSASPDAADRILDALEKHVRVKNLRAFGNGAGGINDQLKLEIVPITPSRSGPSPCVLAERPDRERINKDRTEILTPGQWIYFKITNRSAGPLYVYLYDIAPDGSIKWIYPDPRLNIPVLLESGKTVKTLNPNNCPYLRTSKPGETLAPFGIETYKLIASTTKINGRLLESAAVARGNRAAGSPLELLLSRVSTNVASRGEIDDSFAFSGWGTASLDIDIRSPDAYPAGK